MIRPAADTLKASQRAAGAPAACASKPAIIGHDAPIFIVGCYRSGTTLLLNALRHHPRIGGLHFETMLFTHVAPGRQLSRGKSRQWSKPLQLAFGVDSWAHVRGDRVAAFAALMNAIVAAEGKSRWVEKTPNHLFHVESILRHFPCAKVIHVLRDGRDVAASIRAAEYVMPRVKGELRRLVAACVVWEWMALEGYRLARIPRYREAIRLVRYEDLVGTPELTLRNLEEFLGVDHDPRTFAAWLSDLETLQGNSSFTGLQGISPGAVDRWRDPACLPPELATLANHLLRPTLRLLGYAEAEIAAPDMARRFSGRLLQCVFTVIRIVRFRDITGYWPPPHLGLFLRRGLLR